MLPSAYPLLRLLDLPAREARDLSQKHFLTPVVLAASGLGALAVSMGIAQAFLPGSRISSFAAALQAVLAVAPGAAIAASYSRLPLRLGTFLNGIAIGLATGGLMAVCFLPLLILLSIVARGGLAHASIPILPAAFMLGAAVVPARIVLTFDDSRRGRVFAHGYGAVLISAFLVRLQGLT